MGRAMSPRAALVGSFLVFFVLMSTWSIASPLMSGPDEQAHVLKAVAVARFQLTGTEDRSGPYVITNVKVPQIFASADLSACYRFKPDVPADCAPSLTGTTDEVVAKTTAGTYPPLYYAIVGLPSRFLVSQRGVYAMRIVSAALCALLLAVGFQAISESRRRHVFLAGALVAVTPVAVFLGGVINPSGMEIAAAVGLWTSLLVALDGPPAGGRRRAAMRVAVTGVALAASRPIAPLWVAMIAVLCVLVVGFEPVRAWARDRRGLFCAVVIGAASVATGVWTLAEGTLDAMVPGFPSKLSTLGNVWFALGHTVFAYDEMIAVFGWLDTTVVLSVFLVTLALGALLAAAAAVGRARDIAVVVGVALLTVLLPVALEVPRAGTYGFVWAGRYTLPIAVGVPILAGFVADRAAPSFGRVRERALVSITVVVALAQLAAHVWALRRYRVGRSSVNYLTSGTWMPLVHPIILLVVVIGVLGVGGWWWWRLSGAGRAADVDDVVLEAPEDEPRPLVPS